MNGPPSRLRSVRLKQNLDQRTHLSDRTRSSPRCLKVRRPWTAQPRDSPHWALINAMKVPALFVDVDYDEDVIRFDRDESDRLNPSDFLTFRVVDGTAHTAMISVSWVDPADLGASKTFVLVAKLLPQGPS